MNEASYKINSAVVSGCQVGKPNEKASMTSESHYGESGFAFISHLLYTISAADISVSVFEAMSQAVFNLTLKFLLLLLPRSYCVLHNEFVSLVLS